MKRTIILIVINTLIGILLLSSNYWKYSKEQYLSEKVLDMTHPFDVSIDTEFLKNLNPAYEQQ